MKRPLATGLGAVLMSLRVIWGFISILIYVLNWAAIRQELFAWSVALDILVLLALSAQSARGFARRNDPRFASTGEPYA